MSEKRLILVVEDERTISNFICRALTANDYKAMSATTGKEALSLFTVRMADMSSYSMEKFTIIRIFAKN